MEKFVVDLRCEDGHIQKITLEGYTKEMADDYVGLLTGQSRWFTVPVPPGRGQPGSVGKCGHPNCGAQVSAIITPVG